MSSVTGSPTRTPHAHRSGPSLGEIGHLGTCPLCSEARGAPPCLACRDELRARLLDMYAVGMPDNAAWN